MKFISRMVRFSLTMSLICFAALMSAQSPDHEQNLYACKNGFDSCDHSVLTQTDKNEVPLRSTSKTFLTAKAHGRHVIARISARRSWPK